MKLAPLIFKPKLVPKVWGGRRLAGYGKELPAGASVGESWDLYDRPGDSAVVASGPFAGQSLQALVREFGPGLLGQAAYEASPDSFPLMVKLIDAREALSVQVHPDDAQAAAMVGPDERGKTEMWVVLEAEAGARVTAGLKAGTTAGALQAALSKGDLSGVLNEFPVKQGDVVFLPAGRIHAIGKGCLMAEVQQNSDTTWRVFDYGRLELGKPRELHLAQAMACIRFDADMAAMPSLVMPRRISASEDRLVECPYFKVSLLRLRSPFRPESRGGSFQLLTCTGDSLRIKASGEALELPKGATALIPATLSWSLEPLGQDSQALWTRA
jgi:mannose-6-phosphate isomerase